MMAASETSGPGRLAHAKPINGVQRIGGILLASAATVAGLAGIGAAALGLSSTMIGLSPIATASSEPDAPALPPGFCAAPSAFRASGALPARPNEQSLVSFVSCRELDQWRRGERKRFEVAGAVSLQTADSRQAAARASHEPSDAPSLLELLADESDAATVTRIMAVAARMAESGAESTELGRDVADEVLYSATLLRLPSETDADTLQVRMSAEAATASGPSTRRELMMPFESGDTLRYMRALLRAGLAADGITRIASAEPKAGEVLASE